MPVFILAEVFASCINLRQPMLLSIGSEKLSEVRRGV
jgi:hypothetical protein